MGEAEILARLEEYLAGKADGEIVGVRSNPTCCPVVRALGGVGECYVARGYVSFGDPSDDGWTLLPAPDGVLSRFIAALDDSGRDGTRITAATARRLLAEVRQ